MIRDAATQRQVDAADPNASTWLSANAGSGKTRVLTDRVARLLLNGVSPQNILCLTYTKAAAAEMQNRLFKRLGAWAMKADPELRHDLDVLGAEGAHDLDQARTLFASALETPGGLKIQTIHSFCASILRRFPLEAGVSPQFREMDDRTAELLRIEVVDDMARDHRQPETLEMLRHFSGAELSKFLTEIAGKERHFREKVSAKDISARLGVGVDDTLEALLAEVFSADHCDLIRAWLPILASGSSSEQKAAATLQTVNLATPRAADLAVLEPVFIFKSGQKEGQPKIDNFPTKGTREAHPDLTTALNDLMTLVAGGKETRMALMMRDRTLALHRFAHAFCAAYAQRKQARGLLDFDDLITKAGLLLTNKDVADWVLFRLDGGIDHVLVDEAQDTSPTQWSVIESLTRELTAGAGARGNDPRSVFVVGDKKQSIYSFQGADPAEFDRMRNQYKDALSSGSGLQTQDLQHSFRSSQAILRVVDATFNTPDQKEMIGDNSVHQAFHTDLPGRVDLWPVIPPVEKEDDKEDWFEPVDTVQDSHHDVQLARQIAAQIKRMIRDERLPVVKDGKAVRRPITEGDFLILVQRRSQLFSEIIRACKNEGLQVAGADRFRVGAVLAVKDIVALLSFLALPDDDLSLATALRSPLFGWSEQDLFSLAHHRPENGVLWEALRKSDHSATLDILQDLLRMADFMRPFDLIDRILRRHDGRRRLLSRLGAEAEDGIDAMLSQAMAYEQLGVPSLTGFLSWIETDELEVKRQMDNQGDQIRVMSVHGAKGLEAPIVILPDCGARRNEVRDEILTGMQPVLWKTRKEDSPAATLAMREEQRAAQERERMRLLYVAMTRAEQWLIVAAAGDLGKDGKAWHDIVSAGLAQVGPGEAQAGNLTVTRHTHGAWNTGEELATDDAPTAPPTFPALSDVTATTKPQSYAPSDLGGAKSLPGETDDTDAETLKARGRLLHLLLEHRPDSVDLAHRILQASPDALDDTTHDQLISDAFRLFGKPDLEAVFGPDARAEVPITATLDALQGARINGAIDRLIMTDRTITAVDFKSNRIVPTTVADVPEGLLRQMGAYHAALVQIFPDHAINVAILWTATGTLMPLPTPKVAAALNRVTIS